MTVSPVQGNTKWQFEQLRQNLSWGAKDTSQILRDISNLSNDAQRAVADPIAAILIGGLQRAESDYAICGVLTLLEEQCHSLLKSVDSLLDVLTVLQSIIDNSSEAK
jgi:hypothetical protein